MGKVEAPVTHPRISMSNELQVTAGALMLESDVYYTERILVISGMDQTYPSPLLSASFWPNTLQYFLTRLL